jgi:hypothetical protein
VQHDAEIQHEISNHNKFCFQGTVLIKIADELLDFSHGEENLMEE